MLLSASKASKLLGVSASVGTERAKYNRHYTFRVLSLIVNYLVSSLPSIGLATALCIAQICYKKDLSLACFLFLSSIKTRRG